MVSGSRQRNSTAPLAHGVRSRTQIMVGTNTISIATTVSTASDSDVMIAWYSASSANRLAHAASVRPPWIRLRVEKSAIAYSGNRKNAPNTHPQCSARHPGHRSHLAVRRISRL